MANSLVNQVNCTNNVAMVMLPYPAQGHINPLLHFAGRLVSAPNISIYFTGTTIFLRQARDRVHGWDPSSAANMHFQELAAPQQWLSSTQLPVDFVHLAEAVAEIREPFYAFVNELSKKYRRVVVVYDYLMSYVVQDIRSIENAKAYRLHVEPASYSFCFHCHAQGIEAPVVAAAAVAAAGETAIARVLRKTLTTDGLLQPEALQFRSTQENATRVFSGDIYNSNREIEGLFLDLLETEKARGADKVWGLGPFNPVSLSETRVSRSRHACMDWLDKRKPNSVIFVSFGTTTSFSDEQIWEIAYGLERSEQKFLWVLRDADRGEVSARSDEATKLRRLPLGFEEKVKERGIIVRDYAPQLEILGHSATGGFLSHCGWNSCMESISNGVAIATWPMTFDQPRNAVLVSEVLKIGVEIFNWECRKEIISGDDVEKAVRTLMASEKGNVIRKRAKELGDNVKKSMMEGGRVQKELDLFIAQITR